MNQPQVLQRTSVIYFKYLAMKVLRPPRYQKRYSVLPFPPLSGYHVRQSGYDGIFLITIRGGASIQQFQSSIERSRSLTRTRPTLIIPGVFLPLSCVLLFVVDQLSPNAWIMLLAIGNVLWWLGTFLYSLYKLAKSLRER